MLKNWWKKPALNFGFWAIFFSLTLRNESSSCPCQYAIEILWPADCRLSMKSTETANPAISTGNFRFPYQGSKKPTIFWKKNVTEAPYWVAVLSFLEYQLLANKRKSTRNFSDASEQCFGVGITQQLFPLKRCPLHPVVTCTTNIVCNFFWP